MLYEYPEFTETEFFNLEPTTLLEIQDTVYFAVELLEPQIYYWDCNKNKYVHVIYKFAMLDCYARRFLAKYFITGARGVRTSKARSGR